MGLTKKEMYRKEQLLEKYRKNMFLLPQEAEELKDLINRDDSIDEALKMLAIFGLGALIGYLLTKKE